MSEKTLKTRIQNKRGTSTEWAAATNFIPLEGEICFYSDLNKIKIGNGSDKINDLEFVQAYHIILTASTTNSYEITEEQYNGLIGDYNSFIVIGSKIYRRETSGPAPTFKYQYNTFVEEYLLRFASGGYKLIKTNGYTIGTTNTSQTISSPKTFTSSIGIDSSSSSAQGTLNVKIDSRNEGTPFSVTASNLSDGNVFGIKACAYSQTEKPGVLIGSSSVACDVRLGGDADSNAGTAGQVLTSQGPGATPTWTTPDSQPYHITLSGTSGIYTESQYEGLFGDYNSYVVWQYSPSSGVTYSYVCYRYNAGDTNLTFASAPDGNGNYRVISSTALNWGVTQKSVGGSSGGTPTNMVTTDTNQDITGEKTFTSLTTLDYDGQSLKNDDTVSERCFDFYDNTGSNDSIFSLLGKPGDSGILSLGEDGAECEIQLKADAGTAGQVLTSQGSGKTPAWADPKPYHIILTEASNNKYTLTPAQSEGLINDYNSYIVIQNSSGTTSTVYNRVLASAGGYFFKAIGESKTSKTFILNNNTLSPFTSGNYTAEETSNKVSSIIDSNKTSTTLYPSVKAVADYAMPKGTLTIKINGVVAGTYNGGTGEIDLTIPTSTTVAHNDIY